MINRFEFATSAKILFGRGVVREIPSQAASLGNRCLVVTGRDASRAEPLISLLQKQGLQAFIFNVLTEPDIETVESGVDQARINRCDFVIGFGGGSALDAAKAIAALLTNPGGALDYLEVVGRGQPLTHSPAPWIAVPTTAGTGTEVTRNSVIFSPAHGVKASIRSPLMLARIAVIDPELTIHLPPTVTAATGLDALTQVIEPFLCSRTNPLTDGFCREGLTRAIKSLKLAYTEPANLDAREDMCVTSLMGGLALANSGLGAVHGFAAAIGGALKAPHGTICAALLPHVMEANWCTLKNHPERFADPGVTKARFEEITRMITGNASAPVESGIEWIFQLCESLSIPGLSSLGMRAEHLPSLVPKAMAASSMKANPVMLTATELEAILQAAM